MTENMIDSGEQVPAEPLVGPGCRLREAREAQSLTLEAVAKHLHIDLALVRALEEDDFSKFAAPIYITGYLRAYARLLSIAPEPLVEAYQSLGMAAAPPLERVAHLSDQPEPVSSAQVPRWLVISLAVAVVVVVVVIWRSETSKLLSPVVELPQLTNITQDAERDSGGVLELPPQGGMEIPQQILPVPATRDLKPSRAPMGAAVPAPAQAQAQAQAQTQGADLPRATLSLSAEKPSWVEVKDRFGARLFYDLMVPGDTKSLAGIPPFDVLLGYAPGISVDYNGKRVDHSAYESQEMARFRVGDAGTSRN